MFEIIKSDLHPGLELAYRADGFSTDGQAWEVSLLKWKLLLRLCSRGMLVADGGRQTCGLCALYFFGHEDECENCPIKKTGHPGCRGTPFRDYLVAVKKGDLALAKQAVAAEIVFLRSLQMGLDFSYMLYFERDQLWNALQAVVEIAWAHDPPALIHFPDHALPIPLDTWAPMDKKEFQHDEPEFNFATVLNFPEDAAVLEYLRARNDNIHNGPPDPDKKQGIGMIYLTVYREIPDQPASDLVLLNFSTTGTNMSILFEGSGSIRKTFTGLLEKVPGVCGVFNRELRGQVFWLKGQQLSEEINDPTLLPAEIEATLGTSR